MLRRRAVVILPLAALLVACRGAADPVAVARSALESYRSGNLEALAGLTHPENRAILQELRRDGQAHPRWASLFSPDAWRWQAVQRWDGRLGEVRYFGEGERLAAMVRFGDPGAPEVLVVALERRDGRWWFEDIQSPAAADFARGRAAP